MRVIVAIDPGVTTGIAFVTEAGEVLHHQAVDEDDLGGVLDVAIRALHREGHVVEAVVEKMPAAGAMSDLAKRLEVVRRTVAHWVDEVFELRSYTYPPGEWKPSRAARQCKVPRGTTQHEKDAIRMAAYHNARRSRSGR